MPNPVTTALVTVATGQDFSSGNKIGATERFLLAVVVVFLFLIVVYLMLKGLGYSVVKTSTLAKSAPSSTFENNPANFTFKAAGMMHGTRSDKDGFSRSPADFGASVSWPPTPELLDSNAAAVSAWGNTAELSPA